MVVESDEILRSTGGTGDIDRGPVQQVHECGPNRRRINGMIQDQGGVRQGCGLSPDLFNLILETVMRLADKEGSGTRVKLNGRLIDNLRFADDTDLIADMKWSLQDLTNRVDKSSKRMGLKTNAEKTKTMAMGKQHEELQVRLGTGVLKQVTRFVYLGRLITEDGRCEEDVKRRIGLACAAFGGLGKIRREKSISIATKMKLYYALVVPVWLHGSECWSLRKEDERRLVLFPQWQK